MAKLDNKIMRLPRALLSLLDTKSLGQNPPVYPDELQVVLDAYEHYLPNASFLIATTGATVAPANIGDITVPQQEFWLVRELGGQITSTVGGGLCWVTPLIQPSGSTTSLTALPRVADTLAVGDSLRAGGMLPESILMGPGSVFRLRLDKVAGTVTGNCTVLAHRFRA